MCACNKSCTICTAKHDDGYALIFMFCVLFYFLHILIIKQIENEAKLISFKKKEGIRQ